MPSKNNTTRIDLETLSRYFNIDARQLEMDEIRARELEVKLVKEIIDEVDRLYEILGPEYMRYKQGIGEYIGTRKIKSSNS